MASAYPACRWKNYTLLYTLVSKQVQRLMRYSTANLIREGVAGHKKWPKAWADADPKKSYDVVIIGAGGHGLAAAYYLAKRYGVSNVAVLEKGWLGGGNTGRNTTIVRSNYYYPASAAFYDHALTLYEGLSRELNFNIMLSQRGVMTLAHSQHDLEIFNRSCNAMLLNGVDAKLLTRDEVARRAPALDMSPQARHKIWGGLFQPRGGTARHDAVAWAYARAASALGVDIVQNCEVIGFTLNNNRVHGVMTSRGAISAGKVGVAVAGRTSQICAMAGFRAPVYSYALQAFVSEPLKPILDTVVVSPGSGTGVYVSQSDKGELVIGGGLDLYGSYAQRGNLPVVENTVAGLLAMFPSFSRIRMLRQWAGCVDVTHDSSPVIDETPVRGMYVNCGWGTGGFKAIPAGGDTLAYHIANDKPHALAQAFRFDRFETGALIDEAAAAGIAH